jgi:hypothetical protein
MRAELSRFPGGFIEPELNEEAHAQGVKVLLLLGGDFNGLETSGALQTPVDNIKALRRSIITTAWIWIGSTRRRRQTASSWSGSWMSCARSNPDHALSIDVAPWGGYGYDLKHLLLSTDYFNIMMYDCAAAA